MFIKSLYPLALASSILASPVILDVAPVSRRSLATTLEIAAVKFLLTFESAAASFCDAFLNVPTITVTSTHLTTLRTATATTIRTTPLTTLLNTYSTSTSVSLVDVTQTVTETDTTTTTILAGTATTTATTSTPRTTSTETDTVIATDTVTSGATTVTAAARLREREKTAVAKRSAATPTIPVAVRPFASSIISAACSYFTKTSTTTVAYTGTATQYTTTSTGVVPAPTSTVVIQTLASTLATSPVVVATTTSTTFGRTIQQSSFTSTSTETDTLTASTSTTALTTVTTSTTIATAQVPQVQRARIKTDRRNLTRRVATVTAPAAVTYSCTFSPGVPYTNYSCENCCLGLTSVQAAPGLDAGTVCLQAAMQTCNAPGTGSCFSFFGPVMQQQRDCMNYFCLQDGGVDDSDCPTQYQQARELLGYPYTTPLTATGTYFQIISACSNDNGVLFVAENDQIIQLQQKAAPYQIPCARWPIVELCATRPADAPISLYQCVNASGKIDSWGQPGVHYFADPTFYDNYIYQTTYPNVAN